MTRLADKGSLAVCAARDDDARHRAHFRRTQRNHPVDSAERADYQAASALAKAMQLSYKLKKVLSGDAYVSARRHVKQWLIGRAPLRFDVARITRTIDREKFQEIYDRYGMANPGDEWPKYLEIERWMEINLKRVRDLGLDLGGRKRVLDIGCGTGYFLYICQFLGHDVLGMDLDEEPGFTEMVELLGVKRVIWRIEASPISARSSTSSRRT